jgi:galactose dehydrogenase
MHATFHDLKGASVFITGGGSGIGAALTKGFLQQGAKVAFVGRSDYAGFVAEMSAATGNTPLFLRCDVTDIAALQAAMDAAAEAHGPITVLVNNAANDQRMQADTVTPPMWQEMVDVNFTHYFFAAQKAAAGMAKTGGSIINYTSTSYMMGMAGASPYVACNAGIMGLTRALAREWGPRRIRVNAIAPGWVLTQKQMEKWATEESLAVHRAKQCLTEMMQPDDMVDGTLFLASAASRMMTGQVMAIDAGVVVTG